jgi:hypothetical protein
MRIFRILSIESFLFLIFLRIINAQSTSEIPAEKDSDLYIYSDAGKVDIFKWNKDKIRIYCSGGRVRTARYEKNIDAKIYAQSNYTPKTEIYLPETMNINFTSADGDIEIHDKLSGRISITKSSGNINIGDLSNSIELSTGGGDVRLGNITGDLKIYETVGNIRVIKISGKASISTSGGDIIVQDVGSSLESFTKAGKIEIGNVGGYANITNKNGNIEIQTIKGSADINSTGGAISLKNGYGTINAKTTGGDLILGNIYGTVNAETAGGNISVNLFPLNKGKSIIVSGIGNIILNLPKNANPYIHARVKIRKDIERINKKQNEIKSFFDMNRSYFKIDDNTNAIEGKTIKYSGKETVYLETTNSDIEIRK